MSGRGRPMTRQQEREARWRHNLAMNAVLTELRAWHAAEHAVSVAGSPAQQRARQWQEESGYGLPRQFIVLHHLGWLRR